MSIMPVCTYAYMCLLYVKPHSDCWQAAPYYHFHPCIIEHSKSHDHIESKGGKMSSTHSEAAARVWIQGGMNNTVSHRMLYSHTAQR